MAGGLDMKLDSALDDVIKTGRRGGKGNGKGKGQNKKEGQKNAGANKPAGVKKPNFDKTKAKENKPPKKAVDVGKALDMSLDDIVKSKTNKPPKADGNAGASGAKVKKLGKFAAKAGKRQEDGGKGKGKKAGKGNQKGGRKETVTVWEWQEYEQPRKQQWGGKGKGRDSWANDRDSSWGGKGKGRDDYGSYGKGRSRMEDSWEPPRGSMTRDRRVDDRPAQKGGRSRVSEWEDTDVRTSRPQPLGRDWAVRGGARPTIRRPEDDSNKSATGRKIKVTNIPRDLDMRDIKDAFEAEAGRTTSCTLERGTAWIVFTNAKDAAKAVETFDRGELNGKTIQVVFDR